MPTHEIKLYALSTCVHCRRTKEYLTTKNIPFDCVHLDLLEGEERVQFLMEMKEFNPALSFPTLIINGQTIIGFKKERIEELLEAE